MLKQRAKYHHIFQHTVVPLYKSGWLRLPQHYKITTKIEKLQWLLQKT